MTFTASELGLVALASLVLGLTIGFGWADRIWRMHREDAEANHG